MFVQPHWAVQISNLSLRGKAEPRKKALVSLCTSRGACAFSFWAAIQGAWQGAQQTVVCLWAHESRTRDEPPPGRRPQQHQRGEFFCAHRSSNEAVLSGV